MITLEKNNKMPYPAVIFRYVMLLFALSIFIPTNITAKDGYQSMLELRKVALNFIQHQYTPNVKPRIVFARWDKRLKLNKCDNTKIEAFYPGMQQRLGNVSVGLRCTEKKSWTLYLRAFITIQQNIVHSKRFINRGTVITKDDLIIDNIEISNNNSKYFQDPKDIIGKVAKRNITIGKKISATSLKPALIIKRGQQVTIVAKTAGILIRTKGKALSDGAIGQIVKVKNSRSKRKLQATVIAPNTVQINM
ncbi:MAG: flagellar basal body P-ring formation chaperone FlgA [Thiohalomonadales bacterium]